MKSCRVSLGELPSALGSSLCECKQRDTKYSTFMKKVSHMKHSTTVSSSETLSRSHLPSNPHAFASHLVLNSSFNKDEMFVVLRGTTLSPQFQHSSKSRLVRAGQAGGEGGAGERAHVARQRRNFERVKRVLRSIEEEKLRRMWSEKQFLSKKFTLNFKDTLSHLFR